MPPSSPVSGFSSVAPSLSAVTSATSARSVASLPSPSSLPSQFRRFFPILRRPISLSSGHHFRRLSECYRFGHPRAAGARGGAWDTVAVGHWVPEQSPVCHERMSDLIRRGRSMTTASSSDPPAQSTSAATAPAFMDHMLVGPGASQAPASSASSASSVAQPASARRRHRLADTTDTTSTDGTGASGSQPGITTLLYC
ncbi:hypothetical protein L3X38_032181 [Prunus dulcis]|uniref:Uncharacterized protein n=1 Tax=Prunus dulcis TaxID=3755 RepID=A0AAD4YVS6_PRUDU|nr:hypothetical protein L3X38_032181 [Prunus dulcis]